MKDQPPLPQPIWDHTLTRGAGGGVGAGPILRATDRRPGGAARQELHQLLQATLHRSPLGQATAPGPRLGQEAGRATRPSSQGSPARTPRATPPGHRLQAAPMPLVPPRPWPATTPSRSGTRSPRCRRSPPSWTNTGSIAWRAPVAAPRPVRPCRRGCQPGRSAPGCGRSSACWSGATAWASVRSASWSSTCWA